MNVVMSKIKVIWQTGIIQERWKGRGRLSVMCAGSYYV